MAEPYTCGTAPLGGMLKAVGLGLGGSIVVLAVTAISGANWLALFAVPILPLCLFAALRHSTFTLEQDGIRIDHVADTRWGVFAEPGTEFVPYDTIRLAEAYPAIGRYPNRLILRDGKRRELRITDDRIRAKTEDWRNFVRAFVVRVPGLAVKGADTVL